MTFLLMNKLCFLQFQKKKSSVPVFLLFNSKIHNTILQTKRHATCCDKNITVPSTYLKFSRDVKKVYGQFSVLF